MSLNEFTGRLALLTDAAAFLGPMVPLTESEVAALRAEHGPQEGDQE